MTKLPFRRRNFQSLAVKDLLEAREAYHVHLTNLDNVIATAIGRYRIRDKDPDSTHSADWRVGKKSPPRTLGNTSVQPWSWPCILVFVEKWLTEEEIATQGPEQLVPPFLYLSDGRIVPTCVVLGEISRASPALLRDLTFPSELLGGGYPVFTEVQEQQHVGSIACLVADGNVTYALTNRHVAGEVNQTVWSVVGGARKAIGTASPLQLGKRPFSDVYRGWPGSRTFVNLDAALIRLEDVRDWTAQVYGIGELEESIDVNVDNITLDFVGCPVRAFGAASGELRGEIQALFYRYKSLGGFDYVCDVLIGPRQEEQPTATLPGDSGTLWFLDQDALREGRKGAVGKGGAATDPEDEFSAPARGERARRLHPFAMQWGGHRILANSHGTTFSFALATFVSTVRRELDVDLVRDWNIGHSEYWGKLGHYKIAATACELVAEPRLLKLLKANVDNIAFSDSAIESGDLKRIDTASFVPLADVADLVWRTTRKKDEGNHFADMDQPGGGPFADTTLLELCKKSQNVRIGLWNQFYDSLGLNYKRGALPFRVWQIFDQMVSFARQRQLPEFVCAGGLLSHYVGDACQPLHVSMYHHGRPDHPNEERVHSVYETEMVDRFAIDLIVKINAIVGKKKGKLTAIATGEGAALAVIDLMRGTVAGLPPLEVIEAFNSQGVRSRILRMWNALGDQTAANMAEGSLCLASLWEGAWNAGNGAGVPQKALVTVDRAALKELYDDKEFLPAFRLQEPEFELALRLTPEATPARPSTRRTAKKPVARGAKRPRRGL